MYSANTTHTLITVAPDSRAARGTAPQPKPTIAALTYQLIAENPYRYTADDLLFLVHAQRAGIPESERAEARAAFFSTPKACLRCSDLGKKFGWGIHSDSQGRVALYGVETERYRALASGEELAEDGAPVRVTPAMRSSRG